MLSKLKEELRFIRGNVTILMLSRSITDFTRTIAGTYYSLFILELGGTPAIVGMINSVSLMVRAFIQFLGGYIADKHGRRDIIIIASFGLAASHVLLASAPTWAFILAGEILVSAFMISLPANSAMMADSIPSDKRGIGYSLSSLASSVMLISPMVAGFLYVTQGLVGGTRIGLWITAVSFLLASLLSLRLKETLPGERGIRIRDISKVYRGAIAESFSVWRLVPRSAFNLFLIYSLPSFFTYMCSPFYIIYAINVLHVDEFQYAIMMTLQSIVFFASNVPIGKLVDRVERKRPLMASSIFTLLGTILFINGDLPRLYMAQVLFAIGYSSFSMAYMALQMDMVPREHRGKVQAFTNFTDLILASTGAIAGGIIYESISVQMPFILSLVPMIPTVILTSYFIHEPKKREE